MAQDDCTHLTLTDSKPTSSIYTSTVSQPGVEAPISNCNPDCRQEDSSKRSCSRSAQLGDLTEQASSQKSEHVHIALTDHLTDKTNAFVQTTTTEQMNNKLLERVDNRQMEAIECETGDGVDTENPTTGCITQNANEGLVETVDTTAAAYSGRYIHFLIGMDMYGGDLYYVASAQFCT